MNRAAHTDSNNDGKCDTCDREMPIPTPDKETDKQTDNETDGKTDNESDGDPATKQEGGCGGCGSSAALSVIATVGVIGTALLIRKKED